MPAEIDSMMYRKNSAADVPWHKEGTPLPRLATAQEAIKAAKLDWEVIKMPAAFSTGENNPATGTKQFIEVPDRWFTVRKDRMTALGVVGAQYTPLQNVEAFAFFDALVGKGKAIYETVGSLEGGRKIWLLAKLPGEIRVLKDDVTEKYMLLANGHDGNFNLAIGYTPVRVVCKNTLTMAIGGSGHWMSARHTIGVAKAVENIGKLLAEINKTYDRAGDMMQAMAKVKFNDKQARNFFQASYMAEVRDALRNGRLWTGEEKLAGLLATGRGMDIAGVRGTLWAAYNAVTEYEDHERKIRDTTSRVSRNWFGQGAATKLSAFRNAKLVIDGKANFESPVEVAGKNN